jgi:hypothetical protein
MTRTRLTCLAVAVTLAGAVAAIAGKGEVWTVNANLEGLLSGIDFVPSRGHFDNADVAEADLIEIARDDGADEGHRIRAYRALAYYPGAGTEKALSDAIEEHGAHGTIPTPLPVETIYLRAAMHALAVVAGERGVDDIAPMLDHPSRDVRTDAARALAVCGSTTAIPMLRARLENPDEVAQVRFALTDAIRLLIELS